MPFDINPYDDVEITELLDNFVQSDTNPCDLDYSKMSDSIFTRMTKEEKAITPLIKDLETQIAAKKYAPTGTQYLILGIYYLKLNSLDLSFHFFKEATKKNNFMSNYFLATYYHIGIKNVAQEDHAMAYKLAKNAADHNIPQALYLLYVFYSDSIGCNRNEDLMISYLKKSAAMGHKKALYLLSRILINDRPVVTTSEIIYNLRRTIGNDWRLTQKPLDQEPTPLEWIYRLKIITPSDLSLQYHYAVAAGQIGILALLFKEHPKAIIGFFTSDIEHHSIVIQTQAYEAMTEVIERYPHTLSVDLLTLSKKLLAYKLSMRVKLAEKAFDKDDLEAGFSYLAGIPARELSIDDNYTAGFYLYHNCNRHPLKAIRKLSQLAAADGFEKTIDIIQQELDETIYPYLQTAALAKHADARKLLLTIACSRMSDKDMSDKDRPNYLDYLESDLWNAPTWKAFVDNFQQAIAKNKPTTEYKKVDDVDIRKEFDRLWAPLCDEKTYPISLNPAAKLKRSLTPLDALINGPIDQEEDAAFFRSIYNKTQEIIIELEHDKMGRYKSALSVLNKICQKAQAQLPQKQAVVTMDTSTS